MKAPSSSAAEGWHILGLGGEHLEIADAGRHLERMQRGGFRALSTSVSAAVLMC